MKRSDPIGDWYKGLNPKQKKNAILAIVVFISIFILIISNISKSNYNACDCLEAMAKSKTEVYSKCIQQDYDKAFDYWEARDPNRKFQNQEALIQAYWMEKCNY